MSNSLLRSLAFYRPQFHPIPENDLWFGKGYTDWTAVTAAQPLFSGHAQPRLPRDLGFYDLRLAEARTAQVELARQYGIDGFIWDHYWFEGRRLFERPFNDVLRNKDTSFPFALCWANEDIRDESGTLIGQTYSEADDRAHMQWIAQAMLDERYIRIDGKPLFVVRDVSDLPNATRTAEIWREEARNAGVGEIFLTICDSEGLNPLNFGFDAAIACAARPHASGKHTTVEFLDVAAELLGLREAEFRSFPCVSPGFDDTPVRGNEAHVVVDMHPDLYKGWVAATIQRDVQRWDEVILFVDSWNNWSEGTQLEPCSVWGSIFLEAHAAGVKQGLGANTNAQTAMSLSATIPTTTAVNTTVPEQVDESVAPSSLALSPVVPDVMVGMTDRSDIGLTVAIVANGDAERLMRTLRSALDTCVGMGTIDFLVVDNATTDETSRLLDALSGDVRSVRVETQLTAPAAWMLAKQASVGEYVLLVSDDVTFTDGWLEPALMSLALDPTCPAVSPAQAIGDQLISSRTTTSFNGVCMLMRAMSDLSDTENIKTVPESIVNAATPYVTA
jgi:hypothetical protein